MSTRRPSFLRGGLAAQQAAITLAFALLVGLAGGAIDLVASWHDMRSQVRDATQRNLDLVRASAAEAAFQLNASQAENVVTGLLNNDAIAYVRLRDNFGNILAEGRHVSPDQRAAWLGEHLLDGLERQDIALHYNDPRGGAAGEVGLLRADLDAGVIGRRFLELALNKLFTSVFLAVLLSLSLAVVFYWRILKPLVALSYRIIEVEPAAPARTPLNIPKMHDGNEFNDILDFSRIDAGRLDVETIAFDLTALIDEVVELMAVAAEQKGLELIYMIDPKTPRQVEGDPARLRQVLFNLLGNAIKFTRSGEVNLNVWPLPTLADGRAHLLFEVTDTGIGTPENVLGALFNPFTQADSSMTRKYGGTGLGLSIVKRLVELMGGEREPGGQIGVESQVGTGSRFWFSLPFIAATAPLLQPAALRGRTVMVVDDSPGSRRVLEQRLHGWGCTALLAASGPEAHSLLHERRAGALPLDAILLDSCLPDLDGATLALATACRR